MQAKPCQIQDILSQLPKAKIELDRACCDHIQIETADLMCVICYQVPAEPHECQECNALFCYNCIDKLKPTGILVKKCPHCKQQFRWKKISKIFRNLFDNIEFTHCCSEPVGHAESSQHSVCETQRNAQDQGQSNQQTVQIDLPQIPQRQMPPNEQHPLANQANQEQDQILNLSSLAAEETHQIQQQVPDSMVRRNSQSSDSKPQKISPRIQQRKNSKQDSKKPKIKLKSKGKIYKYKDLIYHLEHECPRNRIYTCPMKCSQHKRNSKKMTKKQVEQHLMKDCPKIEITCSECGDQFLREQQPSHNCLAYLKQLVQNQKLEIQELKRNQKPSERHTCSGMFKNEIATEIDCQFCSGGRTNIKCLDCGFYVCTQCW